LKMFWQWCRKVFSNLAMRGIVPLSEVPFVFNSLYDYWETQFRNAFINMSAEEQKICNDWAIARGY